MTVENDFLAFAVNGTPNVEDQADYAASPELEQGYALNEIPSSASFNKAIRQASVIASQLAQMICDYSGLPMLDDADLPTLLATIKTQFRTRLQANLTVYISTTGNDTTGNGTAGAPWATLQHAYNTIQNNYDLNGHQATIQMAAGTYTNGLNAVLPCTGQSSYVIIQGDTVTWDNVILNTVGIQATQSAYLLVQGMKITPGSNYALYVADNASIFFQDIDFGAATGTQLFCNSTGVLAQAGGYTISGGAQIHGASSGNLSLQGPVTLTGTPNFSVAYANSINCARVDFTGASFTGSATGPRYLAAANGVIQSGGNTLPGNSAGSTATGGQYI